MPKIRNTNFSEAPTPRVASDQGGAGGGGKGHSGQFYAIWQNNARI
jgi:hypothetical protein